MGKLRLREDYIRDGYNLVDAGSHPEPINIIDPIMDIYFKFEAKNESIENIRNCIFDVVNEIEVVDGSDVLFSLTPREILALNAYHYKESMHWGINELGAKKQACVFKIPFGLGRYDPTMAFDPTKFKNPQIRFSWDLDNITKAAGHGFEDKSLYVDIIATIAERFPARPLGFLMHKHIHEWTTQNAAAGVHRVEMPVDYTHRTFFLALAERYTDHVMADCPWDVLTKAKYNVDQNKYVPFHWHTDDWMLWLKEFYGMWHQGMDYHLSGATGLYRNLPLVGNRSLAVLEKGENNAVWWSQGTGCKIHWSSGTAFTEHDIHVKLDGCLPFNTWAYPFGDPMDMEEWLQVRDIGKIYAEIEEGIAAEKARIFLTQYRPY